LVFGGGFGGFAAGSFVAPADELAAGAEGGTGTEAGLIGPVVIAGRMGRLTGAADGERRGGGWGALPLLTGVVEPDVAFPGLGAPSESSDGAGSLGTGTLEGASFTAREARFGGGGGGRGVDGDSPVAGGCSSGISGSLGQMLC
jgi:hypothetical protein